MTRSRAGGTSPFKVCGAGGVRFSPLATVLLPYFAHRPDGHHQQRNHPDQDDPKKNLIKHSSKSRQGPVARVPDFNSGGTACCLPPLVGDADTASRPRQILFGMLKA